MLAVQAPVAVQHQATFLDLVVIRAFVALGRWDRRDGERHVHQPGPMDALRRHQRDLGALVVKAVPQDRDREQFTVDLPLALKNSKAPSLMSVSCDVVPAIVRNPDPTRGVKR